MLLRKEKINIFLEKSILISFFIFALGAVISKSLISLGIGFAVIFWVIKIVINLKDYKFYKSGIEISLLLFYLALLISRIDSLNYQFLSNNFKYFLGGLFFYILINEINDLAIIKRLYFTAFLSLMIASGYGLYQHFVLEVRRVDGNMLSLAFGNLLAIFIIFMVCFTFWSKLDLKYKSLTLISGIIFSMNLLYTKSRGAWLGFLAALFSVFIINKKRKYLVVLLLILMISFYVLPSEYINRFESSINVTDNRSNLGRLALWKGSLFMLRDNPLRGVGAGNFQEKYAGEYRQPNTTTTVHAHNNLLHFTAEAGILGLFTFIFLMYSILKVLVKGLKQVEDKNWNLFILSGIGAFIVFNIQGLTEFNFGDTEPLHFFFFLMALNMIVIKIFTDKKINQKKVDN